MTENKQTALAAVAKELNVLGNDASKAIVDFEATLNSMGAGIEVLDTVPFYTDPLSNATFRLLVTRHGDLLYNSSGLDKTMKHVRLASRKLRVLAARRLPALLELVFKALVDERNVLVQ